MTDARLRAQLFKEARTIIENLPKLRKKISKAKGGSGKIDTSSDYLSSLTRLLAITDELERLDR